MNWWFSLSKNGYNFHPYVFQIMNPWNVGHDVTSSQLAHVLTSLCKAKFLRICASAADEATGQQIIQGAPTMAWSKVSLSHVGDPLLAAIKHGNVWKVGIFTAQVETCTNLPTRLKTQSSEHQNHRCLLYQLRL